MPNTSLDIVLDAAERQYRKLLSEAANYEKLKMPTIVKEYQRDHLKPLRAAIDEVRNA